MRPHAADLIDPPDIETTRWRIDPARSSVEFGVKVLWGVLTVKGRFAAYQGMLDLSGQPAIELTIETRSLDTGNERRDTHLRSPDFFGAETHPYMRFVSESATLAGDRLKVRGRLHANGSSVPLELDAQLRRVGGELELEAATEVDRRGLGISWNVLGMVSSVSRLTVKGRLVPDVA
jgi:polyisoprenoid-binding protein YceI